MKKLFYLPLFLLCACGPSAQEVAAELKAIEVEEKHKADSIQNADNQAMEAALKAAADSAANALLEEASKEFTEDELSDATAELMIAEDKLTEIRSYQMLRTPAEKEQQIKAQVKIIDDLKRKIADLNRQAKK